MSVEPWVCLNCERTVELNSHGRCSHCNSDAVSSAEIQPKRKVKRMTKKQKAVKELERMYGSNNTPDDTRTVTTKAREFVDKIFPLKKEGQ